MRGKAHAVIKHKRSLGITPACAGKRLRLGCRKSETKDHPRVCGEKTGVSLSDTATWGSPPRVRGKVCNQQVTKFKLGITPACAGKRPRLPFFEIFGGEKARCTAGIFPVSGSPSRVRGKENVDTYKRRHSRITPACAGKRQLALVTNVPNRDHPRVCGEKPPSTGRGMPDSGSPPRVRGKD